MLDQPDSLPVIDPEKWEKRFLVDSGRAEEAVSLYRSIGYEVRVVPVGSSEGPTCTVCFTGADELVEVWTRPLRRKEDNDG